MRLALLVLLAAAHAPAAVITYTVSDNLASASLPQFNPALGILTEADYRYTLILSGTATVFGQPIPGLPVPVCAPGASIAITAQIASTPLWLLRLEPFSVTGTGAPPTCVGELPFIQTFSGSATAAPLLPSLTGTGTFPLTLSASGALQSSWSGLFLLEYTYTPVPEPSTLALLLTATAALALKRRR